MLACVEIVETIYRKMACGYCDLRSKSETLADYPHDRIRLHYSTQALDTDVRGTPRDCSEENLDRQKKPLRRHTRHQGEEV
jgi:hypothetical protein